MGKSSFFAVKVGRNPGVYFGWADCKAQIIRYESALWKKFKTFEEAQKYCFPDGVPVNKSEQSTKIEGFLPDIHSSSQSPEDTKNLKATACGSKQDPIDIDDKSLDTTAENMPDDKYDVKRYRLGQLAPGAKKSKASKSKIRAMMGLTTDLYNGTDNDDAETLDDFKTETVLPPISSTSIVEISDISTLDEMDVTLTPDLSHPNVTLTNTENGDARTELPKISNVRSVAHTSSSTPISAKLQHKHKRKKFTKAEKLKKRGFLDSSDMALSEDEIIFIPNPNKDDQMNRTSSEDFFRAGSTEQEVAVGIFWDIENVRMPSGMNPAVFITKIREKYIDISPKFCEKHFYVVCDVRQESAFVMKQLFEFHVRIIHVPRLKANSSDNVLRDLMNEFVGYNKFSRVVLISGDSDFSHDIHSFRRNKKCDCVLIHNECAKDSLIKSANSAILYKDLIMDEMEEWQKVRQQNKLGNTKHGGYNSIPKGRFFHPNNVLSDNSENLMTLPSEPGPSGVQPDYIPVSHGHYSTDAVRRAYYRTKRKQMLTPKRRLSASWKNSKFVKHY